MTSLTFSNTAFAPEATKASVVAKPRFGQRFVAAMIASRQRQAEIEIRKVRAMYGVDVNAKIDYALLPFNGE